MENTICPCKKNSCPRHGRCGECRAYHKDSRRGRPVACERKRASQKGRQETAEPLRARAATAKKPKKVCNHDHKQGDGK